MVVDLGFDGMLVRVCESDLSATRTKRGEEDAKVVVTYRDACDCCQGIPISFPGFRSQRRRCRYVWARHQHLLWSMIEMVPKHIVIGRACCRPVRVCYMHREYRE
jgi:hypothetical protein